MIRRWREGWDSLQNLPQDVRDILQDTAQSGRLDGACQRLCNVLNAQPRDARQRIIKILVDQAPVSTMNDEFMLTWDQVREMCRGGWEIGAHTVTHAFVDELDEASVREEIQTSIHRVEQELKRPVRIFSYPRGRLADHVKQVLVSLGVEAAVSTEPGQNRPGVDLHHLRRFDMGICRTPGPFSSRVFDAEVNGLYQLLRRA
jgi:peptidoglycan/xylan/chitin deacetylase (PgdA/CDA1 family)